MQWRGHLQRRGHHSITGSFSWQEGYWSPSITTSGKSDPRKFSPWSGLLSCYSRPGSMSGTEYYLAVVIALLSAVCIHFIFEKGWGYPPLAKGFMPPATDGSKDAEKDEPRGANDRSSKRVGQFPKTGLSGPGGCGNCVGLGLLFAFISFHNYLIGSSGVNQ